MGTDLGRRRILQGMTFMAGGTALGAGAVGSTAVGPAVGAGSDWKAVRAAFPEQAPFVNLDNECISLPPLAVQSTMLKQYKFANECPCYNIDLTRYFWSMFNVHKRDRRRGRWASRDTRPRRSSISFGRPMC